MKVTHSRPSALLVGITLLVLLGSPVSVEAQTQTCDAWIRHGLFDTAVSMGLHRMDQRSHRGWCEQVNTSRSSRARGTASVSSPLPEFPISLGGSGSDEHREAYYRAFCRESDRSELEAASTLTYVRNFNPQAVQAYERCLDAGRNGTHIFVEPQPDGLSANVSVGISGVAQFTDRVTQIAVEGDITCTGDLWNRRGSSPEITLGSGYLTMHCSRGRTTSRATVTVGTSTHLPVTLVFSSRSTRSTPPRCGGSGQRCCDSNRCDQGLVCGDDSECGRPGYRQTCHETVGCAGGLVCRGFQAPDESQPQTRIHDTGQVGPVGGPSVTNGRLGGPCPGGHRRGRLRPSGSSNSTCTARWASADPRDCRVIYSSHRNGMAGHWHCHIDMNTVRVGTSEGLMCLPPE